MPLQVARGRVDAEAPGQRGTPQEQANRRLSRAVSVSSMGQLCSPSMTLVAITGRNSW